MSLCSSFIRPFLGVIPLNSFYAKVFLGIENNSSSGMGERALVTMCRIIAGDKWKSHQISLNTEGTTSPQSQPLLPLFLSPTPCTLLHYYFKNPSSTYNHISNIYRDMHIIDLLKKYEVYLLVTRLTGLFLGL